VPGALVKAFVRAHVLAYKMTGGRIGGAWGKAPIGLLTTTGRRSGKRRTTPVLYLEQRDSFAVVATNNGAAAHPGWYLNLRAHPLAELQTGGEPVPASARVALAEEREVLWPRLVAMYANYERDQRRAERELPVVVLERRREE
jgi:deazaflavin-dependent oxidoreductase (nitroreductase family)